MNTDPPTHNHSHTYTHTHTLTHTLTHTHTHSHTLTLSLSLSFTHTRTLAHTPAVQVKIRDLKSQISSQSKKNFTLDRDLRFFDSKIALLINHKISIEVSEWVTTVVDA